MPLSTAVSQAHAREMATLAPADAVLEQVQQARRQARDEAITYARLLHRFRKESRREQTRQASAPEAYLLFEAARSCAEAIAEANMITTRFEAEVEPRAVDALQEHEERRLEALAAAFSAFATTAEKTATLDTLATVDMRRATGGVDVPADICGFATTYAGAAMRGADALVPPSFCEELAIVATGQEQSGFWGALWRPLKGFVASLLGDDGTEEKRSSLVAALPQPMVYTGSVRGPEIVELDGSSPMPSPRIELCIGTPIWTKSAATACVTPLDVAAANFSTGQALARESTGNLEEVQLPTRSSTAEELGSLNVPVAQSPRDEDEVAVDDAERQPMAQAPDDATRPCSMTTAFGTSAVPPFAPMPYLIDSRRPASVATLMRRSVSTDETEMILSSVDDMVAGLGGAGLTVAEAALIEEQVLDPNKLVDDDEEGTGEVTAALEGEWYFQAASGEVIGPLTWAELRGSSAQLTPGTFTFVEGAGKWLPAEAVPHLLDSSPASAATTQQQSPHLASLVETETPSVFALNQALISRSGTPPPAHSPPSAHPPPLAHPPPPAHQSPSESQDVPVQREPLPTLTLPPREVENSPLQGNIDSRPAGVAKTPTGASVHGHLEESVDALGRLGSLRLSRSRRRETAMRRRSSVFASESDSTEVGEGALGVAAAPATSAASSLLGAIEDFDKESRLRKVRRKSSASANSRRSTGVSGHTPSANRAQPLPASTDMAAVIARAIMRRRTESRIDEDSAGEEEPMIADPREQAWATSP